MPALRKQRGSRIHSTGILPVRWKRFRENHKNFQAKDAALVSAPAQAGARGERRRKRKRKVRRISPFRIKFSAIPAACFPRLFRGSNWIGKGWGGAAVSSGILRESSGNSV